MDDSVTIVGGCDEIWTSVVGVVSTITEEGGAAELVIGRITWDGGEGVKTPIEVSRYQLYGFGPEIPVTFCGEAIT